MLYINCAVYRARLALYRMPMRWPNARCIGKVEELSPVSHELPLTGFVSLGAVNFASWLLRCTHRKLGCMVGLVQLCAGLGMLVHHSHEHRSPFSVFMLIV